MLAGRSGSVFGTPPLEFWKPSDLVLPFRCFRRALEDGVAVSGILDWKASCIEQYMTNYDPLADPPNLSGGFPQHGAPILPVISAHTRV